MERLEEVGTVKCRFFIELMENRLRTLLVMEFQYDDDADWYEIRVFRGSEVIGYVHGYANRGWDPQVNNIWVAERMRRRGIATAMMRRVETFFGQIPQPGTPIEDNEAARRFWAKYMTGDSGLTKLVD
jgi:ribosomal protein S18 acetylase RimI-like enzyme